MFKNVAAKFMVFAFDATTNVPKTGDAANITAYVAKDYGTVTVLGDTSATEMDATNAPGYYLFDAAQAETNGDCLLVSGKSATANIKVLGAPAVIYTRPTTGWLAPATAGRTLVVDASGLADANTVKVGPTGSGTAQTAGDIFSKVTGLTFTVANQVDVNVKDWAGTAVASAAAGIPKVDVDTIKTNPVVNAGTITFPTTATLASTTNITAGTITTVGTLTTYTGNTPQTGDSYARLGAPAGASIAADLAEIEGETDTLIAGVTVTTNNDKTGYSLSVTPPTAVQNADALLARNIAGGSSSGRIVTDALRFLRNKWSISGTTLTVTQEDDTASAWTATITTDAAALPITSSDPA